MGRPLINSTKLKVDGIKFASKLETYMYNLLKNNDIEFGYESEVFQLIEEFELENDCFEKSGRKPMTLKTNKKIRGMQYTPDFVSDSFIIETKGFRTDSFSLRWKIFKAHLNKNKDNRVIYVPSNKAECDIVVKDILSRLSNDSKKHNK